MANTGFNFTDFEIKGEPTESEPTKIVEAYGLGKCPKLVSQVADSDLRVRINALGVLCDEFKNPYSIDGCIRAGVITKLAEMIVDPDYVTRVRASEALKLAAADANGLAAIISNQEQVFPQLATSVNDPSEDVRRNIYSCLLSTTRTAEGVTANVSYGITKAFVAAVSVDIKELKPTLLNAINNLVGDEQGLLDALEANVVEALINLLERRAIRKDVATGNIDDEIIAEAARALGYLCYDGRAKQTALDKGAVNKLIILLKEDNNSAKIKTSLTVALMAITITNDGKIQVNVSAGLDVIMRLLYDDSRAVVLNSLKIISNLAVYPKNREVFMTDSTCMVKIRKLSKSEDKLVSKHATATLDAVSWTP